MARIRSIKPEFWQDEKLVVLPDVARLIFLGLISLADDCGRLLDKPVKIEADLFDGESDRRADVVDALAMLSRIGVIRRGKTASGQRIIEITNWRRHQRVDHPNLAAAFPEIVEPSEVPEIREPFANDSRAIPDAFAHHINDQRPVPTIYDQRPTTVRASHPANRTGTFVVEVTAGSEPDRASAPLTLSGPVSDQDVEPDADAGRTAPTRPTAPVIGPAFATQKAELLAACDDVQALALETLVRNHRYPDALIGELYAIACGQHPVTGSNSGKRADILHVIGAVSEMVANGQAFSVKLFRGYVRKQVDRPAEPASAEERHAAKTRADIEQRAKTAGVIEPPRSPEEKAAAAERARTAVLHFRRLAKQADLIDADQRAKHERGKAQAAKPVPLGDVLANVFGQAAG